MIIFIELKKSLIKIVEQSNKSYLFQLGDKMKLTFLTYSLFFLVAFNCSFSQTLDFNLKNLDNINVQVRDEQGLLSRTINDKIKTEVKLKLMSSGMNVSNKDEAQANLNIIVHAIESNFAEHRILVLLTINENVTTKRSGSIQTDAITYSDYSFFKNKMIEESVYNKIMDEMIIKFIENYLGQK
jgi:hypothetical protein